MVFAESRKFTNLGSIKLGRFKLEMNWNQEELEQWAIAARQKEEDFFTWVSLVHDMCACCASTKTWKLMVDGQKAAVARGMDAFLSRNSCRKSSQIATFR